MQLFTLSYLSAAQLELSDADIAALANRSQVRNRNLDITGLLLFDGGYFMQTLEGPRDAVAEVFRDILKDPRHSAISPFAVKFISDRKFPTWAMQLVPRDLTLEIVTALGDIELTPLSIRRLHQRATQALNELG
ncbi:blue light sensor protein [Aquicoccus sp. SCR17]|nr:blue light sensor protein [Carideicomes alvinocaridis]